MAAACRSLVFARRHCGARQLASTTGWLSSRILPSPEGVVEAFWSLSVSGELWQHLAISSWRAVIGFSIGGSIGLTLGLISGLSRWGERLLDTSIQMLRNVPHLALIPLVILWFGIDESAKIFLSRWGRYSRFTLIPGTVSAISIVGWWRWHAAMVYPVLPCLSM
jgi:sulfonate transport system permease protein